MLEFLTWLGGQAWVIWLRIVLFLMVLAACIWLVSSTFFTHAMEWLK